MRNAKTVFVPRNDAAAMAVAQTFVQGSPRPACYRTELEKRERWFGMAWREVLQRLAHSATETIRIPGKIWYGPEKQPNFQEVELIIGEAGLSEGTDWIIASFELAPASTSRIMLSPRRIARKNLDLPAARQQLLVSSDIAATRSGVRDAACLLASELTLRSFPGQDILRFVGGQQSLDQALWTQWTQEKRPVHLFSGCCIHANRDKQGVVESLSPELVSLLVRTAQACFAEVNVESWTVANFGPLDYDWLADLGALESLLPYMRTLKASEVREELNQSYALHLEVVRALNEALPFPVQSAQFHEKVGVDMVSLRQEARLRAGEMYEKLRHNPPAVFLQLDYPQKLARLEKEALLYLIETAQYGYREGSTETPTVAVVLEVHGKYWLSGRLNQGPDGAFLPLAWMPQAVTQHWGEWAANNRVLQDERRTLDNLLRLRGF